MDQPKSQSIVDFEEAIKPFRETWTSVDVRAVCDAILRIRKHSRTRVTRCPIHGATHTGLDDSAGSGGNSIR